MHENPHNHRRPGYPPGMSALEAELAIQGLDDVDDGDGDRVRVREWLREYLEGALEDGFDGGLVESDAELDPDEDVRVLETGALEFYVPLEDIPAWIDPGAAFPVEADSA